MEKKAKILTYIIVLFTILSSALFITGIILCIRGSSPDNRLLNQGENSNAERYTILSHGDSIIIFDTYTGEMWSKYYQSNSGPIDWEKDAPINH